MTSHWSLGILIGLPAAGLLLLVAVAFLYAAVREQVKEGYAGPLVAMAVVVVLAVVIGTGALLWPWRAQYHRWQPMSGVVTDVSSRFLSGDHGTNQKFVVEFGNDPDRRYGCNDTRCALVKVGDTLTLSCKRTWQWSAEPGWDCNYVRDEATS